MTPTARRWPGPLGTLAPALLLAGGAAWAAPGTAAAPGPASAEAPAGPAVARTRVAGSPRQFPNPTLLTQDGT